MFKSTLKHANSSQGSANNSDNIKRKSYQSSPWDTPPLLISQPPSLLGTKIKKKVLVLDLDETLIHSRKETFESGMIQIKYQSTETLQQLNVAVRPGVEKFLQAMSKLYTLVIYTAGSKEYAELLLNAINIKKYFAAVLHRGHCQVIGNDKIRKDLKILGVPMKNVLLIDDSPLHCENQQDNVLITKAFLGDAKDRVLDEIIPFLTKLAEEEDVRSVSKKYTRFLESRDQPQKSLYADEKISVICQTSSLKNTETLKHKKSKILSFECDRNSQGSQKSKLEEDETEDYNEDFNENLAVHKILSVIEQESRLFDVIKSESRKKNKFSEINAFLKELSTADTKSLGDFDLKYNIDSSPVFSPSQEQKRTF